MIRLSIGISTLTPAWITLFQQLGVIFEEIDFSKSLSTSYSCLIINGQHVDSELAKIQRFLTKKSGGLLVIQDKKLFEDSRTKSQIAEQLPDIYLKKIAKYYAGSGLMYSFDFNLEGSISANRYHRKRFPFKSGAHPDELVSTLDRNSLIHTLEFILKELHYHRKLPYLAKWKSPSKLPYFGFRVDTDFGTKASIKNLYAHAEEFEIPMTWFLHVQAHEEWQDVFHQFKNQEIALHGYEHGTSTSYEQIYNNIEQGFRTLLEAGFNPKGFCVPYSIWNDALGDVLEKFEFDYSSEFTLGYDSTPFYPIHNQHIHSTLQIPIHPICTGSLNRKKVSESEMTDYFMNVIEQKISQLEPVIFYHHPLQPAGELWKKVFNYVNQMELPKLSFYQISDFWKHRISARIEAFYDEEQSVFKCSSDSPDLLLQVSIKSKEFYLIEASKVDRPLHTFEAIPMPTVRPDVSHLKEELEGNRLQLLKTSILDWKNRIKL